MKYLSNVHGASEAALSRYICPVGEATGAGKNLEHIPLKERRNPFLYVNGKLPNLGSLAQRQSLEAADGECVGGYDYSQNLE